MSNKFFLIFAVFLVACTPTPSANETSDLKYIGNSLDECSRIKFVCVSGMEYFSDEKGCGCKTVAQEGKKVPVYCTPEQKQADFCTLDYNPVCGFFNQDIKCIKYPCAQTYSNGCGACIDEKVEYYVSGECPQ